MLTFLYDFLFGFVRLECVYFAVVALSLPCVVSLARYLLGGVRR